MFEAGFATTNGNRRNPKVLPRSERDGQILKRLMKFARRPPILLTSLYNHIIKSFHDVGAVPGAVSGW
jgi:hypothetical protein